MSRKPTREPPAFVVLSHPSSVAEVAEIRGILDAAGVNFYVNNEHFSEAGLGSQTMTLMVQREHLVRAREELVAVGLGTRLLE